MNVARRHTHQVMIIDSAHHLHDTNATQPVRDSNYCLLSLKANGKWICRISKYACRCSSKPSYLKDRSILLERGRNRRSCEFLLLCSPFTTPVTMTTKRAKPSMSAPMERMSALHSGRDPGFWSRVTMVGRCKPFYRTASRKPCFPSQNVFAYAVANSA